MQFWKKVMYNQYIIGIRWLAGFCNSQLQYFNYDTELLQI
jgi:hypothetical protein